MFCYPSTGPVSRKVCSMMAERSKFIAQMQFICSTQSVMSF